MKNSPLAATMLVLRASGKDGNRRAGAGWNKKEQPRAYATWTHGGLEPLLPSPLPHRRGGPGR